MDTAEIHVLFIMVVCGAGEVSMSSESTLRLHRGGSRAVRLAFFRSSQQLKAAPLSTLLFASSGSSHAIWG